MQRTEKTSDAPKSVGMSYALTLPPDLVDQLRRDARETAATVAAEEARSALATRPVSAVPLPAGDMVYARRALYARRIGFSTRKLDDLIAAGLPTIGSGRTRRIDVAAADAWLKKHLGR